VAKKGVIQSRRMNQLDAVELPQLTKPPIAAYEIIESDLFIQKP
jgi:hypothetical protein